MSAHSDEPEEDISHLWMIPFADLMTILVIFFLGLFAFSFANKSQRQEEALQSLIDKLRSMAIESEKPKPLEEALEEALAKALGRDKFAMTVSRERVQISLPSPVLFEQGSADLNPSAQPPLSDIAGILKGLRFPILVEGHTDSVPLGDKLRFESNWELSAARAFAVSEVLAERGVDRARLHALGRSSTRPAASNATPEGRAANRRISISVMRDS